MVILGLTGSIGMGKSTAAGQLRAFGVPVHDADRTVHRLLAKGGRAVAAVDRLFPGVVRAGAVDRRLLGTRVFGDPAALARLEAILHPLVQQEERRFLARMRRARRSVVALDIPLLLESRAERRVDRVIVLSCPAFLQEQRVLARPGMTREKLAEITKRQMDDHEKRRRADLVVPSGAGRRLTLRRLRAELNLVRSSGKTKSDA